MTLFQFDQMYLIVAKVEWSCFNYTNTIEVGGIAVGNPERHVRLYCDRSADPGTTFTSWSQHHFIAIGNPERHVRKASHRGCKQQLRSCSQSPLLLLARATYIMVLCFTHIPFVVNHTINATPLERLQQWNLSICF